MVICFIVACVELYDQNVYEMELIQGWYIACILDKFDSCIIFIVLLVFVCFPNLSSRST